MLLPMHDIERTRGTLPSTCGARRRYLLVRPSYALKWALIYPTIFRIWIHTFHWSSFVLLQLFPLELRWLMQIILWPFRPGLCLWVIALILPIVVLIHWRMRWFIRLKSSLVLLLMGLREPNLLIALVANEIILLILLVIPVQLLYTHHLY